MKKVVSLMLAFALMLSLLPVIGGVAASLGVDQAVLCFGLLSGATLGGNLTPVGALWARPPLKRQREISP